ncbi:MAG: hypothetical protein H6540_07660 [Bacteroidales bacterium]|nr:hypothetical protein [Bacteroidales bacterium]
MPALTKDQLRDLNPEKIYNIQTFLLHYELWPNIDTNLSNILNSPIRIQFDEQIRNNLGAIKYKKGVYFFFIEPEFPFVPNANYLMYVGKVVGTNTFFSRFYEYVSAIGNKNKRRNIQLLTNLWPGKTWVYFYDLTLTDNQIEGIEQNLYDNILPPLNNQFRAKRALNSRSIYN